MMPHGRMQGAAAALMMIAAAFALAGSRRAPQQAPGRDGLRMPDRAWVRKTLSSLSLRDKVAQLVQIRVPGRFLNRASPEFRAIEEEVRRNHVGGVILFAGNIYESAVLLNDLQRASRLPLIVAADFERGAAFRIADTTSFPWTMAVGAAGSEELAYQEGVITGREARALGVHWVYAPVVDVNNNPDNPVINIRSYGEDPKLVARLAAAFIRGAHREGVLTTAKHFPGHGDTATDSHIGLAVVPSDRARLESVELVPFRSAVAAGVDSIMTAHVAVPRVTGEAEIPATLSSKVLTDLLRGELQFEGLVVTDALEMGGITSRYWSGRAAVRALEAGADLLLLPPSAEVAIEEVVRAVRRGDLTEARIDRSVEKILAQKSRLGLERERIVPVERIATVIASPESQRIAAEIADRSVTLVKDARRLLPIDPIQPPRLASIVLSAEPDTAPGAQFQTEVRRRFPSVRQLAADVRAPDELVASIARAASEADVVVCATIVRVVSGRGTVGLPARLRGILDRIFAAGKPVVSIAFGSPYILRDEARADAHLCTFSYADVSQVAAAKALSGEIAIGGKLPVTIPGAAKLGEGIEVPKLDLALRELDETARGAAFPDTRRLLGALVAHRAPPRAALAVGHRRALFVEEVGQAAAPKSDPLPEDLATLLAGMLLQDSGQLLLDAAVADYVPELLGPAKESAQVRDLLEQRDAAASRALREIVTRAAGGPPSQFVEKELFAPMRGDQPASSELGSIARNLARAAQMLCSGGIYDHRRYLRPETVVRWRAASAGRPLGWQRPPAAGFSASAYGLASESGTMFWVDPERESFVVLAVPGVSAAALPVINEAQQMILRSVLREIR